jgi:ATP-dependent Clp protease protease subunit
MKQKTKQRIRKLTDEQLYSLYHYNIDKESRVLFFGPWHDADTGMGSPDSREPWEVSDYSAINLIKGLHTLEQEGNEQIIINWFSDGGDWCAGMSIYDYLKKCKSYITIKCYGRVRSMGTIILQAADERQLSSNCMFLMHYGSVAHEPTHSKDFELFAGQLEKDNQIMENIYLERIREKKPRYSKERLQEMIKWDKYMTPQEALDMGLADSII